MKNQIRKNIERKREFYIVISSKEESGCAQRTLYNKEENEMAQIRDYRKLAHDIICEVGGKRKIFVNATRCATRLRLVLKEEPEQAKREKLQQWRE